MNTVLVVMATVVLALSLLITFVLGLSTGFFTQRCPTGSAAMGLVVPIFLMGGAWILTLLGAWLCVGNGGFDWVSERKLVPVTVVTFAVIGAGLCATAAFNVWLDRKESAPQVALFGVLLMPALLQVFIACCLWRVSWTLSSGVVRAVGLGFVPVVLMGYIFGGIEFVKMQKVGAERARMAYEQAKADEAERERRGALTEAERVTESYATFTADAPLWTVAGYLVDSDDPDVVRVVVERVRKVPDLDRDLRATLNAQWASIRGIALRYVRVEDERRAEWAPWVAESVGLLAKEIREAGTLDNESSQEKIPAEIACAAEVTTKFAGFDFRPCLSGLRAAVEGCAADERRERALERIDVAMGAR